MKQDRNFRPTQREIDEVTQTGRRDARRGTIIGGITGAAAGSLLKKSTPARLAGALTGAIGGNIIGRRIGRRQGAKEVVKSRSALLQNMGALSERLNALEARQKARSLGDQLERLREAVARHHGREIADSLTQEDLLSALTDRLSGNISKLRGAFSDESATTDFNQNSVFDAGLPSLSQEIAAKRARLAARWGYSVVGGLADDELTDAAASRAASRFQDQMRSTNAPGAGSLTRDAIAQFSDLVGEREVNAMSDAELRCHLLSASRRGLLDLERPLELTDFGLSDRIRNQDGQFIPGGEVSPEAIQRTYSPGRDRKTGRNTAAEVGVGAGLATAIIAHRKLKKARLPRLKNGDASRGPAIGFARRTMRQSPFGGPRVIIRRPRRNSRHFGIGSAAAEGVVDALGLGGIGKPKKKKILVDQFGNVITPTALPDPGTTSTSSFAMGKLGGIARRFGPDALTIGAADLTAEEVHDALQQARSRKKKRARQGGIEATPGLNGAPQTMSARRGSFVEFEDALRQRMKRRATVASATAAGAAVGAYAGLRHEPGHVAGPGEIRPGSTIYRRREGIIPTRHYGVVDESGNVAHRSSGGEKIRNVKVDSFRKLGKGRTFVQPSRRGDRSPSQVAAAASAARGTSAGRYSTVRNNCEHTTSRLAGGKPVSRQVRRGFGGAAAGALTAGAAGIIANRRKPNR